MYHKDGYSGDGGGGDFSGNFTQNNFQPLAGSPAGQPSLLQQQQVGILHHEEPGEFKSMGNGFQAEISMLNQQAFAQNGFIPPVSQFSIPQPYKAPSITPATTPMNLNTRAAELKAKLLRGRQGSTPPVVAIVPKMDNSTIASPRISLGDKGNGDLVDDLIQQYAPPTDQITKDQGQKADGSSSTKAFEHPKILKQVVLGSPKLVTNPETQNGTSFGKSLDKQLPSNDSMSELSEGEIVEDPAPVLENPTSSAPRTPQLPLKTKDMASLVRRGPRDEELSRPTQYAAKEESYSTTRPVSTNIIPQAAHIRDNSRGDTRRDSRRQDSLELNDRRSSLPENRMDSHIYKSLRGSRDHNEIDRRTEVKKDSKRDDARISSQQSKQQEIQNPAIRESKPTLDQVLPYDADLREWLDITGYHNREYRDKILIRRRKIAALDAQKAQLLLEMEIEERGGLPATGGTSSLINTAMPPPPTHIKQPTPIRVRPDINQYGIDSETERNRVASNKRAYSPLERDEPGSVNKIARTEEGRIAERRGSRSRIKDEEDEHRGSRSFGYDPYRSDRHDDLEYASYGTGDRGRSLSPPMRGIRDHGIDDFDDASSNKKDSRPFEVVGGYRGRAFDPRFRGRGRGRGRGEGRGEFPTGRGGFRPDFRGDDFDSRDREETIGNNIAYSQPYKDRKGFPRGGKGETRYFIVKSFNEDNVIKCMKDGIWTTQKQNGDVFREAFENCKDVILVFSINKSRAFQGYARMESLPGSVSPPPWQKAITWESAGAFRVRWLVICTTHFRRIGHLKNALNENQAVLIGKDGQEIEENCGAGLIELINEEYKEADKAWHQGAWDDRAY